MLFFRRQRQEDINFRPPWATGLHKEGRGKEKKEEERARREEGRKISRNV